jgi:hypothetical protein
MYTYNINVLKTNAFQAYLDANFTAVPVVAFVSPGSVQIQSFVELTTEQQSQLAALVAAYTDPSVYLVLAGTESHSGVTETTNSTTLRDVQAFCHPRVTLPNGDNVRPDGSVLDQIKVFLKLSVADVSTVADLGSGNVGIQIYDKSRNIAISDLTVDVSAQLQQFQAAAQANETGFATAYKSVQIYGLRSHLLQCDCMWVFRLSSPDSRITVSMNGFQKLFFTLE